MNDIDVNIDIDGWNENIKDIKYKIYVDDNNETKAIKIYRHEQEFGQGNFGNDLNKEIY